MTYVFFKKKKLIQQMIIINLKMNCKALMRVARLSVLLILFYFIFSAIIGIIMNNNLYGTVEIYKILTSIHGISTFLVPLSVLTHIGTRLAIKRQYSK